MKKRLFILKLSTLVFVMLAYSCADKSQKTDADKKLGTKINLKWLLISTI